jgi:hypothetical protein
MQYGMSCYVDKASQLIRHRGWETSDLMYNYIKGVLTILLIDNGYINKDGCGDESPRYMLEA